MKAEAHLRTKILPLPKTRDDLFELFRKLIELPAIQDLRITPQDITVQRLVHEGEDVVPSESVQFDSVDGPFLAKHVAIEPFPFEPEDHPYLRLVRAFENVSLRGMVPVAVVAPSPALFSAFIGFGEDEQPETFFGVRVLYLYDASDKCLVVGSETNSVRDAILGIAVDMGD